MIKHAYTTAALLLFTSFFTPQLYAQDKLPIKFGKVNPADFDVKSPVIDSNSNAVVVADVGTTEFIANTSELSFSLIYKQKKRIKIINKNGFDAASVIIPLYVSSSGKAEKLEDFKAYTYNLENDKVTETKLEKDNLFSEKHNEHYIYKKFTFPAVKEGSILEYSYSIKSDFIFNLQPWEFQGEYPVLWSQYETAIPEFFKYVILSQGYQPFTVNKIDKSQTSFSFTQHVERDGGGMSGSVGSGLNTFKLDALVDYHTWIMKDVPALKEESYTTTLRNSIAKIEFQLSQIAYPRQMPENYMNSWEKVASDLMDNENFGNPISRPNNWLDDETQAIAKGAANAKEKTRKIYEYVRDNFTCNDKYGIETSSGLKEVFKNKSGSVADINMLLIAMLKNQQIPATPVILSTRRHGVTHDLYPLIDRYNYVVAKADIGNDIIYLDATERKLPFGKLPLQVYNGHAREITKEIAIPVYFMADSVKETGMTNVIISNMDKGGVEGTFTHTCGDHESLELRNEMIKKPVADYKKSLVAEYPEEIVIDNINIDSLTKLDEPVALKYDLKLKAFESGDDVVYLNPMLGEAIAKNPFAAAKRFYPVEMPCTSDDIYTFYMEIPKGYAVDEVPKSVRFNFNETEGMFEYIISASASEIQMRCRLVMRRANFTNEDYDSLREFYTFVVKKESEQIVFKKIK